LQRLVYDLNLPGSQPAAVTLPTAIDELDYDSIHQRIYLGNTTAPFFLTGIDLTGPLPGIGIDAVTVFAIGPSNRASTPWMGSPI
jgi:hypothetical protein